ncbi:hypothetical protein [Fimbriimonas ginsengisoli]|uniref:Lipoprotein n=1 Tax=Fimbriimonas ginsengisoli Gsoil 348 TaxID=661478 RepID=A0A068NRW7_FIMGI|nr:hypothetical protein [Fimbriimonas ginsengisoli]AIE84364.1 hypothetical protein OP10G_0996 [Fimbriimonas ginsengisoli Gsoil 348]
MRRILSLFVLILVGIFGLSGCGGSGTSGILPENPDPGIYEASFSRGGGRMTVTTAKNNSVTVVVADDAAGVFTGTGSLRSDESFSVTCKGPNDQSIVVTGTLQKSALSKKYVGKIQGSFTFTYDAPLALGNVDVTLFAGTYTGTVDMRNFDSWPCTVVIDANGFITVNFTSNTTPVSMRGLLYSDGHAILRPDDTVTQKLNYWGKGAAYLFFDLGNLYFKVSISTKKDGNEVGVIRTQTPYLPG